MLMCGLAAGGKQDYGDKGLASAEKSMGVPQNAKANEMITDKGRDGIEGATGKSIPHKVYVDRDLARLDLYRRKALILTFV